MEALEKTKGAKLITKIKRGQTPYRTKKDEKGNVWVLYYEIYDDDYSEQRDEKQAERHAEPVGEEEAKNFEDDFESGPGFEMRDRIGPVGNAL